MSNISMSLILSLPGFEPMSLESPEAGDGQAVHLIIPSSSAPTVGKQLIFYFC